MEGLVSLSDNYVSVFSSRAGGYKLFDKNGKYHRTISSRGQGPGEYASSISDSYIDEDNNNIYMLQWANVNNILVFDLQGNFRESIPLAYTVPKARFKVDNRNKRLTIAAMLFPNHNTPSVIWIQDFQGNVIQEVAAEHYMNERPDFSNEIETSLNMDVMDFSILHWAPTNDTLYHFDETKNILRPVFALKFGGDAKMHSYIELPSIFMVRLYEDIQQSDGSLQPTVYHYIAVDKKTLRGSYVKLAADMLGGIPGSSWITFNRGYYIANMYSHELKAQLETALASKSLSKEIADKIRKINHKIGEDDNNIVLIGRLKKETGEIRLQAETKQREEKVEIQQSEEKNTLDNISQTTASNKASTENTGIVDDEVYGGRSNKQYKMHAQIQDYSRYCKENNQFKNWDPDDRKEVKLSYIAEKNGTASNIEIMESCGNTDLDNEAIRLIKEAKLIPGTGMKDEPIRILMAITVYFPPLE